MQTMTYSEKQAMYNAILKVSLGVAVYIAPDSLEFFCVPKIRASAIQYCERLILWLVLSLHLLHF